jgi:hypothetical protein
MAVAAKTEYNVVDLHKDIDFKAPLLKVLVAVDRSLVITFECVTTSLSTTDSFSIS